MPTLKETTKEIADATGRPWADWFELLHQTDATNLHHNELPSLAQTLMPAQTADPGAWASRIASAFELDAARRRPGRATDGTFQGFVSAVLDSDLDASLQRWQDLMRRQESFNSRRMISTPVVSSSRRWRYWSADFSDGTETQVDIGLRGRKSTIAVNITKAQSMDAVSEWKNFWRQILTQFADQDAL